MNNRQVNLHCHTVLCKHATGTIDEYCKKALEEGLQVRGFTEYLLLIAEKIIQRRK